jgi:hypothetical protein
MTDDSIYQPLPCKLRAIRLLQLQPGRWGDHVEAELQEFTLSEAHDRYTAISYTWGQTGTVKQVLISCNSKRVPISENLFTILRRLRRIDYPVLVWADALCINQTDAFERTHQVGLMGDIYRNSKETMIWLGEQDVPDGIEMLEYMSSEDQTSWRRGAPPRVAWEGTTHDNKFLNTYAFNKTFSTVKQCERNDSFLNTPVAAKSPNDIFGAFCVIQSLAQGLSTIAPSSQDAHDPQWWEKVKDSNRWHALTGNYLQGSRASRVWNGLERLMSRPWVSATFLVVLHC